MEMNASRPPASIHREVSYVTILKDGLNRYIQHHSTCPMWVRRDIYERRVQVSFPLVLYQTVNYGCLQGIALVRRSLGSSFRCYETRRLRRFTSASHWVHPDSKTSSSSSVYFSRRIFLSSGSH